MDAQLRQLAKQVVSDCFKINGYLGTCIPGDVCVGGPARSFEPSVQATAIQTDNDALIAAQL